MIFALPVSKPGWRTPSHSDFGEPVSIYLNASRATWHMHVSSDVLGASSTE